VSSGDGHRGGPCGRGLGSLDPGEDGHPKDSTFVKSATCPWFVFGDQSKKSGDEDELSEAPGDGLSAETLLDEASPENPLRQKPVQGVIRFYMNLRAGARSFVPRPWQTTVPMQRWLAMAAVQERRPQTHS
jgi:hypothetical protein